MQINPSISVFDQDQKAVLHTYVKELLETVGLRVDCPQARELLTQHGATTVADQHLAIPGDLIEWAIQTAPKTVSIFDRAGNPAFTLGEGAAGTRFGVGVTNLYYQDPATDEVTPFTMAHLRTAVRLGHRLDGFDLVSTPGVLKDKESSEADLWATLTMTANTTKPLVLLISEEQQFIPVLDLIESLHGRQDTRPAVIPYFNPITPLVLNAETARKMAATIERGIPFIYSNYGMSGATTPITPGGSLVMLTAELLGGLVYAQLLKAGTPVILGSLPAAFDMQSMQSMYTPHAMLLNLACAEMMAYYGLPHSGTSGCVNGWGADLQLSGTMWMNHLTSCMGKVGLAPFVGGSFDSLAFSPAIVVLADEIIRLSRQFAAGFTLERNSAALDDVAAVGPGGNFLTSKLTFKLFRQMACESSIWPRYSLEQWQEKRQPTAETILRKHTLSLVDDLAPPADHDELMDRGTDFIRTGLAG
jgi:trimethylamine--corrinoid protein Co-methyltransferase